MFGENLQEQMVLFGQPQTTGGCVQTVLCLQWQNFHLLLFRSLLQAAQYMIPILLHDTLNFSCVCVII